MEANISILFYLRKDKINNDGLAPIFRRITINGQRLDNSTGQWVEPSKWSQEGGKMKGTTSEARLMNSHLDLLKTKVY